MPWPTPTLTDLIALAQADVSQSTLPGADSVLPISNLNIMAMVQARMAYDQYGYIAWLALNSLPFTATGEFLEAWAALKGVYRKDASPASGTGVLQFTGLPGGTIPDQTPLVRSDGFAYVSVGTVEVAAGQTTLQASILATTPGSLGNVSPGAVISLQTPLNQINSAGTISLTVGNGADQELDPSLQSRMFLAYSSPPQGGDAQDYVEWALAVPEVTRAWCAPNQMGAGTVVIYFMCDLTEAANGGFPQGQNGVAALEPRSAIAGGDQLVVANAIFPQQPVTALVYAAAPINQPVAFTFIELSPNTAAMQALVITALQSMFLRTSSPIQSTIYQSAWDAALVAIPGLAGYAVSVPSITIFSSTGYLPTLGAITWPN